ncbi:MAG: hypothetical protein DHS20C21_06570 [Gemmatimonadota bacterium]|nr:MAG: hypothetical protein DHS20C21_06570 [Gemmatimonadota bacterium]
MTTWIRLLFVPCLLLSVPAGAEVWKASEHRQIQDAIESAAYGDTVLVAPGTYGKLVLRPGVQLIAEKGPDETLLTSNSFWVVKADGLDSLTTIEGFSIDGQKGAEGVIRAEESNLVVKDCVIKGGWSGFRGLFCDMTIQNCTFRECQNGIYLFESQGSVVNNDIQLCITGITLVSAAPRIVRNTITRNTLGFRIAEHSDPTIGGTISTANRVWNNVSGAVKNEAYQKNQGLRTMKPKTLRVPYNFWGSDCPDSAMFRGNTIEWGPWVDESGKRSLDVCEKIAPE